MLVCSSEKLKPFWLSIPDLDVSAVATMSNCLQSRDGDSREYRAAVSRALAMPTCKLVPFFGTFLRDLRSILANVRAIVVFPTNAEHSLEVVQTQIDGYIFLLHATNVHALCIQCRIYKSMGALFSANLGPHPLLLFSVTFCCLSVPVTKQCNLVPANGR